MGQRAGLRAARADPLARAGRRQAAPRGRQRVRHRRPQHAVVLDQYTESARALVATCPVRRPAKASNDERRGDRRPRVHLPGAADLNGFWDLLVSGATRQRSARPVARPAWATGPGCRYKRYAGRHPDSSTTGGPTRCRPSKWPSRSAPVHAWKRSESNQRRRVRRSLRPHPGRRRRGDRVRRRLRLRCRWAPATAHRAVLNRF